MNEANENVTVKGVGTQDEGSLRQRIMKPKRRSSIRLGEYRNEQSD